MYTREQFAKTIDHTLLRPDATKADVMHVIEDAREHHFAAVVVSPSWVGLAGRELEGSDVKVAAAVSFPFGGDSRAGKCFAIKNAIANGANEIDAVLNVSRMKSGEVDSVRRELSEMAEAVHNAGASLIGDNSRRVLLKVIIETCYLTASEKELVSKLARDVGVDFVQTSTGTGPGGATCEDIRLIRRAVGPASLGIKASGGVRTVDQAIMLLDSGANRIGTSSGTALFEAFRPED